MIRANQLNLKLFIFLTAMAVGYSSAAQSVSITTSSQTVCAGSAVTFNAETSGLGPCKYYWQIGSTDAEETDAPSLTTSLVKNNDTVFCVAITETEPEKTYTSNSIVMSVSPVITPQVTLTPVVGQICGSGSLTFTAFPVGGGSAPTYQWQVNGINEGDNSSTFTTAGLVQGDKVKCIMYSSSPCVTTNPVTSKEVAITVLPDSYTYVSIQTAAKDPVCKGSSITFTPLPTTTDPHPAYQWYVNGSVVSTDDVYITSSLIEGDVVTCDMTSASGCFINPVAKSGPVTIHFLQTAPAISIIQNTLGACEGIPVMYTADVTNAGTDASYQWQVNGTNTGTNAGTFISSDLKAGDKIDCVLSPGAACSTPVTSNVLYAAIYPAPVVAFAAPVLTMNQGSSVVLSPQVSGDIATYKWLPSTGLSSDDIKNPVASPAVTTIYTLQVTSVNSCMASAADTVKVVPAVTIPGSIIIPNTFTPNNDGVNDTWVIKGLELYTNCTVNVYDRYGSLVYRSVGYTTPWDGRYKGRSLPSGTYYYIIDPKYGKPKRSGSVTILK